MGPPHRPKKASLALLGAFAPAPKAARRSLPPGRGWFGPHRTELHCPYGSGPRSHSSATRLPGVMALPPRLRRVRCRVHAPASISETARRRRRAMPRSRRAQREQDLNTALRESRHRPSRAPGVLCHHKSGARARRFTGVSGAKSPPSSTRGRGALGRDRQTWGADLRS